MKECRKERRFKLKVPCLIYASGDSNNSVRCQTVTSNISNRGALVETDLQLPAGKMVFIELPMEGDGLSGSSNNNCIKIQGRVIRANGSEMALVLPTGETCRNASEASKREPFRPRYTRIGDPLPEPFGALG